MIKTAITEHGQFKVYANDHIGKIMLEGTHYEAELISIILNNCMDKNGAAIDVGANIGTHTIAFGKHFNEVFAFEPQRICYELLRENIANNPIIGTPYNYALGHTAATVSIKDEKDGGKANYGGRSIGLGGGRAVKMRPLDDTDVASGLPVKLIKIDVEGAEKLVIYGARKTIRQHKPVVFFECAGLSHRMNALEIITPEVREFDLLEFFTDCGYRSIRKIKKNILMLP